jgi:hypothetical protein
VPTQLATISQVAEDTLSQESPGLLPKVEPQEGLSGTEHLSDLTFLLTADQDQTEHQHQILVIAEQALRMNNLPTNHPL